VLNGSGFRRRRWASGCWPGARTRTGLAAADGAGYGTASTSSPSGCAWPCNCAAPSIAELNRGHDPHSAAVAAGRSRRLASGPCSQRARSGRVVERQGASV